MAAGGVEPWAVQPRDTPLPTTRGEIGKPPHPTEYLISGYRQGLRQHIEDAVVRYSRVVAEIKETRLVDDLDGGPADETVRFALDNTQYEIDLSTVHAEQLKQTLEPWIAAGRRVAARTGHATRPGGSRRGYYTSKKRGERAAIRDWARAHGFEVSDRGRMPAEVWSAYRAGSAA